MYDPKLMPFEHNMVFQRWTIWENFLNLSYRYVRGTLAKGIHGLGFYSGGYGVAYKFRAYAPDVTAPIDMEENVVTRLLSAPTFTSAGSSFDAVAVVSFNPDVVVTWGGPIVLLKIDVPGAFFAFEHTVHLSAYTDPVRLDGKMYVV